jgi:RHS repeat-associated protein
VFSRVFDDHGHLLAFTDALEATTVFERDFRGRELRITDPLGRTTTIERYPGGGLRQVTDAAGGVTRITPTESGLTWIDPNGAIYTVSYEPRGQIQQTIAPGGAKRSFVHDAQGNLVEIIDPDDRKTLVTYDGWGRCASIREPDGSVTTFERSLGGQMLSVREGEAITRYQYDGDGNVTAIHDAAGGVTRMVYGGMGRLCITHRPDGALVRLKYDREGRIVEVHNARGEVHSITYNVAGMRVNERTFDGRELGFKYDLMGRLIASTNGLGARTEYEHDLAGQLKRCVHADDTEVTFEHDALGAVIAAVCPAGRFSFERNAVGWIIGEVQDVAGEAIAITTEYDLAGDRTAFRTSLDHSASFARSPRGACDTAILDGTEIVRFTHDFGGRETTRLLAGGGRIETEYGPTGSMARRRVHSPAGQRVAAAGEPRWVGPATPGTTVDRAYQYSTGQGLAAIWDSARGITRFRYDALGRLLALVPENAREELFAYDANGNLTEGADPCAREYGAGGRLDRKGDTEFLWNDAGQLVERRTRQPDGAQTTRYTWWETGLLRSVERPDGALVELTYDPWARRISKRVSAREPDGRRRLVSSTRFVWDGTHLVHEIRQSEDASGAAITDERTYLFEDVRTIPLAHRDARTVDGQRTVGEWFHYLNDDTGAPEALLDGAGVVACDLVRTPWGEVTFAPGHTTTTPLRFRGQYADEETGLSYNRHRYYDPAIGRYISSDPVELLGGMNLFAYAGNCPTSAIDVEGLSTIFSVIRDEKGTIVGTGFNGGDNVGKGPFGPAKGCAEVDALNGLGSSMGKGTTSAEVRAKFTDGKYTMETYKLPSELTAKEKADLAASSLGKKKGKGIPTNALGVCPCETCGTMIKGGAKGEEPSIQSQILANNNARPGGEMTKWKGTVNYGK